MPLKNQKTPNFHADVFLHWKFDGPVPCPKQGPIYYHQFFVMNQGVFVQLYHILYGIRNHLLTRQNPVLK